MATKAAGAKQRTSHDMVPPCIPSGILLACAYWVLCWDPRQVVQGFCAGTPDRSYRLVYYRCNASSCLQQRYPGLLTTNY